MESLITTRLLDQVVTIRYSIGDYSGTYIGQIVEQDGTFIRVLGGELATIVIPTQSGLATNNQKTIFKLADAKSPFSYEIINIQYIISINVSAGVDQIIKYGQEHVVCDNSGNYKVVYNNGPVPMKF